MKLYKLKSGLLDYYRTHVENNQETTMDEAQRKLTRNILLAHKADSSQHKDQLYQYGRLWIWVRGDKIVGLKNKMPNPQGWAKDKKRYIELTKELGIDDNISMIDLHKKDAKVLFRRLKWKFKKTS